MIVRRTLGTLVLSVVIGVISASCGQTSTSQPNTDDRGRLSAGSSDQQAYDEGFLFAGPELCRAWNVSLGTPDRKRQLPPGALASLVDDINGEVVAAANDAGLGLQEALFYVSGMWDGAAATCPLWFENSEIAGRPDGGETQSVERRIGAVDLTSLVQGSALFLVATTSTSGPPPITSIRLLPPPIFGLWIENSPVTNFEEMGYWLWNGPEAAQPDNRLEDYWLGLDAPIRNDYIDVALHNFTRMSTGGPDADELVVIEYAGLMRDQAEQFVAQLDAGVHPAVAIKEVIDSAVLAGWSPEAAHSFVAASVYWVALPGLAPEYLREVDAVWSWDRDLAP